MTAFLEKNSIKMGMAMVVLLVVSLAVTGSAQSTPACAAMLVPCANYLNVTSPPESCCGPLKDALTNDLACLCGIFKSPDILKAYHIDLNSAIQLPKHCGMPSFSTNIACNTTAAGAPGASMTPPEIIICRNYKNCNCPVLHFAQKKTHTDENDRTRCTASDADIRMPLINEVKRDEELHQLITVENITASVHAPIVSAPEAYQNQDAVKSVNKEIRPSHVLNFMDCVNYVSNVCLPGESCIQSEEQTNTLGSLPCSDVDPPIHSTIAHDYKGHPHTEVHQKLQFR